MLEVHLGVVGLLVGTQVLFTLLAIVNVRYGDRAIRDEREWLTETLDVDDPDRIRRLRRADVGLSLLQSWFVVLAIVVALYAGPFERAVELLETAGLGTAASGAGLFVLLGAGYALVVAPVVSFEAYVVRALLKVSRPPVRQWLLARSIRAVGLAVVIGAVGGVVVTAATTWPGTWWIGAWGTIVAAAVFGQVLYPQLRHRVLDDPEQVTDGPVYEAVTEVFERAGAARPAVSRTTGEKHGSTMDAHVTGVGQGRVVLSDAMIEELSTEELQGVVAHELAHLDHGHLWKGLVGPAVQAGLATALVGYLAGADWLYDAFGLPADATHAGVALALVVAYPVVRLTAPLRNGPTVAYERQADAYASDVLGDPEPLRSALSRISRGVMIDPFPHDAYVLFHYTHPPIPARLRSLREDGDDANG